MWYFNQPVCRARYGADVCDLARSKQFAGPALGEMICSPAMRLGDCARTPPPPAAMRLGRLLARCTVMTSCVSRGTAACKAVVPTRAGFSVTTLLPCSLRHSVRLGLYCQFAFGKRTVGTSSVPPRSCIHVPYHQELCLCEPVCATIALKGSHQHVIKPHLHFLDCPPLRPQRPHWRKCSGKGRQVKLELWQGRVLDDVVRLVPPSDASATELAGSRP
jgi:hypothetical protein